MGTLSNVPPNNRFIHFRPHALRRLWEREIPVIAVHRTFSYLPQPSLSTSGHNRQVWVNPADGIVVVTFPTIITGDAVFHATVVTVHPISSGTYIVPGFRRVRGLTYSAHTVVGPPAGPERWQPYWDPDASTMWLSNEGNPSEWFYVQDPWEWTRYQWREGPNGQVFFWWHHTRLQRFFWEPEAVQAWLQPLPNQQVLQ